LSINFDMDQFEIDFLSNYNTNPLQTFLALYSTLCTHKSFFDPFEFFPLMLMVQILGWKLVKIVLNFVHHYMKKILNLMDRV
jgi:hypothetical protein